MHVTDDIVPDRYHDKRVGKQASTFDEYKFSNQSNDREYESVRNEFLSAIARNEPKAGVTVTKNNQSTVVTVFAEQQTQPSTHVEKYQPLFESAGIGELVYTDFTFDEAVEAFPEVDELVALDAYIIGKLISDYHTHNLVGKYDSLQDKFDQYASDRVLDLADQYYHEHTPTPVEQFKRVVYNEQATLLRQYDQYMPVVESYRDAIQAVVFEQHQAEVVATQSMFQLTSHGDNERAVFQLDEDEIARDFVREMRGIRTDFTTVHYDENRAYIWFRDHPNGIRIEDDGEYPTLHIENSDGGTAVVPFDTVTVSDECDKQWTLYRDDVELGAFNVRGIDDDVFERYDEYMQF